MKIDVSSLLLVVNQLFELEKKSARMDEGKKLQRNLRRMREAIEKMGLSYHNPIGERFDETRTDCEASIAGTETENLVITEVIKPIVHLHQDGFLQLLQPGIVVVSERN
jgi:molecular chaperone GrpE (heat shock protein)